MFGALSGALFGTWGGRARRGSDDSIAPPPLAQADGRRTPEEEERYEIPDGLRQYLEEEDGATLFGGAAGQPRAARRASPIGGRASSSTAGGSDARRDSRTNAGGDKVVGRRVGSFNISWTEAGSIAAADAHDVKKRMRTFDGYDWRYAYGSEQRVYACISHANCEAKVSFRHSEDGGQWDVYSHGTHAATARLLYTGKGLSGEFMPEIDALLNAVRRRAPTAIRALLRHRASAQAHAPRARARASKSVLTDLAHRTRPPVRTRSTIARTRS